MTNPDHGRELSIMVAVNRAIDELHHSLGLHESEFFCECGHIACGERITLTRAEYARLRDNARPVISGAHRARPTRALPPIVASRLAAS
jgi:hypothetical protein